SSSRVSSARRHETTRSGLMCAARIWVPPRSIARIDRSATSSTGLHCSGRTRNRPLDGGHRVSRRHAAERPDDATCGGAGGSRVPIRTAGSERQPPILNILVPHTGQVPWVAGLPFFIVILLS